MQNQDNTPNIIAHGLSTPTAFSAATKNDDQALPTLLFDPENYIAHLKHLDVTDEQANAFLSSLWHIMHSMVDMGMGLNSIQFFAPPEADKPMIVSAADLQSTQGTASFNGAATPSHKKG
jgi:hypothetical protein